MPRPRVIAGSDGLHALLSDDASTDRLNKQPTLLKNAFLHHVLGHDPHAGHCSQPTPDSGCELSTCGCGERR